MHRPLIPYALSRPPALPWRMLRWVADRFDRDAWPAPAPQGGHGLGFVARSAGHAASAEAHKTVIMVGAARGGTSMVASVVNRLGVYTGDWGGPFFEHSQLQPLLRGRWVDKRKVFAVIGENDLAHDVWGWKYPLSHRHVRWLMRGVRNPYFIAVFRDPLAVACREQVATGQRLDYTFQTTLLEYRFMLEELGRLQRPVLLCSYEKALNSREAFVDSVVDFLGLTPDAGQIAAAVESIRPTPRDYDTKSRRAPDGATGP